MNDPQVWEIWYADFGYEESKESKDRPALVIEIDGAFYVSAMITSHEQRNVWGDIDIAEWRKAGLDHESTIRLSRVLKLSREHFRKKIGVLSARDIDEVQRFYY